MERELKFRLSPAAAAALADHPLLRDAEAETHAIVSTYFDTEHDDLARRGLSLRVRRQGDKRTQTLKSADADGAAFDRGEWEWPIDRDEPDLDLARQTRVADDLPDAGALHPVVTTDVVRQQRLVSFGGATIEVDWDEGKISAGGAETPLQELELELRAGPMSGLFKLALALNWQGGARDAGSAGVRPAGARDARGPATLRALLTIEPESKAARGYRLRSGAKPRPRKSGGVDLRGASIGEGFARVVRACLGHALANQGAAVEGDVEGVHQTRVAIRRLRSALKLFAPCLASPALDAFQNELRRIGRVFGEARDWDVFRLEILPEALDLDGDPGSRWLAEAADARRSAAQQQAQDELNSHEHTALVLALSAWAEERAEDSSLTQKLSAAAPGLLDGLAQKVKKRARGLEDGSPGALHPLRKSLKKLRYGVEFLSSLYPSKVVDGYLERLEKLQKTLGVINDSATATELAASLAQGHIELAVAVGEIEQAQERQRLNAMRKLDRQWRKFQDEGRFWE